HNTQNVKYGLSATAPENPSKASTQQYDYTFTGWDKEFTNVIQNLDIYPQYTPILRSYTITYDYQGATTVGVLNITIYYDSNIILPNEATFEKEGYNFKGWFTSPNGEGDRISTTDVVTGDITIYAYWEMPEYKVSYFKENIDGKYTLQEDDTLTLTDLAGTQVFAPAKVYEGFELDTANVNNILSASVNADGTTELKAYYRRVTFTVTFYDAVGGVHDVQMVKYQADANVPSNPVKTSTLQYIYIFTGWDKTFNNVTQNLDVYPQFSQNIRSCTITYNYGEATLVGDESNSVEYGNRIILPDEATFSKTNYEFGGWYYNDTFAESEKVNANDIVEGAVTIYAKWVSQPKYIVNHYKENIDGTYSLDESATTEFNLVSSQIATAIPVPYEGFEENIAHADRVASHQGEAGSVNTLKLYYSRKVYTVNFYKDSEGTLIHNTQNVKHGLSATAPQNPEKQSTVQYEYTFTGWDKEFTNVIQNLDVYPQYIPILRSYTVTYDYQGATTAGILNSTIYYGSNIILPDEVTFEKVGYNFKGWFTLPNGEGNLVTENTVVTGDITIYAHWEMPEYSIKYYKENLDGGYSLAETETERDLIGQTVTAPDKNYQGFTLDEDNPNNELSSTVLADGSTVLKAYYNRNVYTVTFDYQGATVYQTVYRPAKHGANIFVPDEDTFSRDGYTFVDWFTDVDGNGVRANTVEVTDAITVYAYWTLKPTYIIEHYLEDLNGDYLQTPDYSDTHTDDEGVTVTAIPNSYEGFEFDAENSITSGVVNADNSTRLKLFYKRIEYTVTFYYDESDLGSVHDVQIVKYQNDAVAPQNPSKPSTAQYNYTFLNWDKAFNNVTQDLDVYPVYEQTVRSYDIIYDYQGATVYDMVYNTVTYGTTIIIPESNTFEKTGYNFKGWYTSENGNGSVVSPSDIVTSDITIYACWEMPEYSIQYYKENLDGSYSWAETEAEHNLIGQTVTVPVKNYQGFTVDENNPNNVLSSTVLADGSTVLKAYYKRNEYQVIFYDANNVAYSTQNVKYMGSATAPQNPSKASTQQYDYTFSSWDKAFDNVVSTLNVYPLFSQNLRSYTVSYDYQGATTSGIANATLTYGSIISLPDTTTFSKTGYAFDAWYTGAEKTGTKIDSTTTITGNITIYAAWNVASPPLGGGGGGGAPVPLTVKFNSNGGSEVESIKVELGGKISAPQAPTKDGYVFAGWFSDKALKNKYNFDNVVKAGMTLYAAWEEETEEDKKNEEDKDDQSQTPLNEISKVLNTDPSVQFIKGDDNGNFNPNNHVTRAEVSVMLYRLLLDTGYEVESTFVDIPHDEWYSIHVKTLASNGIIKGYEDGCFYPMKSVTRAEFATILSRLVTNSVAPEVIFSDVSVNHWAYEYIAAAYKNGWIMGYEDGNFNPDANLNRAEAVTIMNRVLGKTVTGSNECVFPDVPKDHWAYDQICASSN
ncbi:MAG: InlB B-repeat-containing protein, partial [Clostridia bacterium]|nr:InlB B-repeat-containing protein [Clostridia bacterium]